MDGNAGHRDGAGGEFVSHANAELVHLADHLGPRCQDIIEAWLAALKDDPLLNTDQSLPRAQLLDHIPQLLRGFEQQLRDLGAGKGVDSTRERTAGAAHGVQRWKQGYDLREVARELGWLNECVVVQLDRFADENPRTSHAAMSAARRAWAALCRIDIEASICEYVRLQQSEAAAHVAQLEQGMKEIRDLERQRGELWRDAAHDLRGNLGVVANVTAGLSRHSNDAAREEFVRILMRNLESFRHLIDDVTGLAHLQAGLERRVIAPLDATIALRRLCESVRPIAEERGLYLRCEGPAVLSVEGDQAKICRIAQNLVLNAVKYTRQGGISVSWGDSEPRDQRRWVLCVEDTGPGLINVVGRSTSSSGPAAIVDPTTRTSSASTQTGEGIGLSIVKRLCELLDASVEMQSTINVGTTFRILFPRNYAQ
jgi:signal transduction histidine kinase